jgi:hypothetical protein
MKKPLSKKPFLPQKLIDCIIINSKNDTRLIGDVFLFREIRDLSVIEFGELWPVDFVTNNQKNTGYFWCDMQPLIDPFLSIDELYVIQSSVEYKPVFKLKEVSLNKIQSNRLTLVKFNCKDIELIWIS